MAQAFRGAAGLLGLGFSNVEAEVTPSRRAISFRALIGGEVMDFLRAASIECATTEQAVVELVSALSNYEEEGAALRPRVILCNDVQRMAGSLGENELIRLGSGPRSAATAQRALKACAPLASRRWYIFLEREGESLNYGLVAASQDPLATGPNELLTGADDPSAPVVLIQQTSRTVVELRDGRGRSIEFSFSGDQTESSRSPGSVRLLARAATADVPDTEREITEGYLFRCVSDALASAHGALVAVLPLDAHCLPKELSDAVSLHEAIDVADRVRLHRRERSSQTMGALETLADLIAGMLRSDGILVLRSDGRLMAYRAFVALETNAEAPGGARSRAYSVLEQFVNDGQLAAAFFCSHDGHSSCCGAQDG